MHSHMGMAYTGCRLVGLCCLFVRPIISAAVGGNGDMRLRFRAGRTVVKLVFVTWTALLLSVPAEAQDADEITQIKQGIAQMRGQLENISRTSNPYEWHFAQILLSASLTGLGAVTFDTEVLDEAIAVGRSAYRYFDRKTHTYEWAFAAMNLGNSQALQGAYSGDNRHLQGAIGTLRGALDVFTRDLAPKSTPNILWAQLHSALGLALATWGEREIGTQRLHEAIAEFNTAFEVLSWDNTNIIWANTQVLLGLAYLNLGRRDTASDGLDQALAVFDHIDETLIKYGHSGYLSMTRNARGLTLAAMSKRAPEEQRRDFLTRAVALVRASLQDPSISDQAYAWGGAQHDLGTVLLDQIVADTRAQDPETRHQLHKQALSAFKASASAREREKFPLDWAVAQLGMGDALRGLAQDGGDDAAGDTAAAEAAYRAALTELPPDRHPRNRALAQAGLADVLALKAALSESTAPLPEAIALMTDAEAAFRIDGEPVMAERLAKRLSEMKEMVR